MADTIGSIKWILDLDKRKFDDNADDVDKTLNRLEGSLLKAENASKLFAASLAVIGSTMATVIGFSTKYAARTETLGVAMEAVANSTGNSIDVIREQEKAMKDNGITTQESREILTRFMQSNLDVAKATDIARAAQDAAVISNTNSSDAAAHLVEGIAKQNTEMIKTAGITGVTAKNAYERFADSVGKSTEQLTEADEQHAFLNETLLQAGAIAGTYEASLLTVGKKLSSMDRLVKDAANAIGQKFLPAFGKLVDVASDFLKTITEENVNKVFGAIEKWAPVIAGVLIGALLPAIVAITLGLKALAVAAGAAMFPLLPFIAIGAAVGFAFKLLADQVGGFGNALYLVTTPIQVVLKLLKGFGKALWAVITGDFGSLEDIVVDTINEIQYTLQKSVSIIKGEWESGEEAKVKATRDSTNKINEEQEKLTKEQLDRISKEETAYKRSQEERKTDFKRRLAELIWAHQDKSKQLKEDLATEEGDYKDSLQKRAKDHALSMEEIEARHQEKVETLERQLKREEQRREDKVNDVRKQGEEELEEEEKAFKKREAIIESQIQNELSKGDRASQDVLATLNTRLENERALYAAKVQDIEGKIEEETKKAIDSNKHRIEDLQISLEKEQESHVQSLEEKKAVYEAETEKLKDEHVQKVSDLEARIYAEEEILNRHQDSVDSIKDEARLDDIARLKRSYGEQQKEHERAHNERIADIKGQAYSEGHEYGKQFIDGVMGVEDTAERKAEDLGKKVGDALAGGGGGGGSWGEEAGKTVGEKFVDSLKNLISDKLPGKIRSAFEKTSLSSRFAGSVMRLLNVPGFADGVENFGGGMAVVGEAGPELVRLPKGSDVIPNDKAFGSAGAGTYNVYIDRVNERSDVDMIVRELGFRQALA